MHDCQKFREDWIAGLAEEFDDCQECRSFCAEAQAILQATEARPIPELSEQYWDAFEDRLRQRLVLENASRTKARTFYIRWSAMAAAAAGIAVVVTFNPIRMTKPSLVSDKETPKIQFAQEHIQGLDPMVVAFLGQSELFLRSFTKIEAGYDEDLDDAKAHARQSLKEIAEQKTLAGDFSPVRIALDEYESVLREIKNLDPEDDLDDIQTRIRKNGLIANLNAYQPQLTLASQR